MKNEIVFEIAQEADGGFTARTIGEDIFMQGDTWDELKVNAREAVQAFYLDSMPPVSISFDLCAMKCRPSDTMSVASQDEMSRKYLVAKSFFRYAGRAVDCLTC